MKTLSLARRGAPLAFALLCSAPAFSASPYMAMPLKYQQHNLVSDGAVPADHTDPNLVNAWGIAFNPFGPVWIADNGSGVSTLYDGAGNIVPLVVDIPTHTSDSGGAVTGIVYNGSQGFTVNKGMLSGPAVFLFDSEDGVISGWAPNVDSTHAIKAVDHSRRHAIYKGLALSGNGSGARLYATDFHNNRIEVFDASFNPVMLRVGAFRDAQIPAGYAPFGIQNVNGDLYVTYAKQDADRKDDVPGPGFGYVDIYDPDGKLLRRFAAQGALNAPWGIALAPAGFGRASGRLLIGNFGDGRIDAYDFASGMPVGPLGDAKGNPIQIDGLWGLAFGNGYSSQSVNSLYFTAGPNDEADGLYGRLDPAK
jgi:uncharacterized protein (TIGR03118 family)